jgi:EmrB/QacA subfamily drug resistance transporter
MTTTEAPKSFLLGAARKPSNGHRTGKERGLPVADGPQELHGRKLALVFTGLMLIMLLAALDSTIVATALPTIAGDLGGLNHISWVTTAYLLAQTVVTPLYGKLGDQYGRRIVLQVGLVIFLIGSALCGISQSFPELIAFRAFQGLGGGGLMVSAQAAIGDVVPPRQRGRYQGLFGGVFGLATVIGPLIGGTLTTNLSWRWIFYINLPIGVLALVVLALTFPSVATRIQHRIDYLGGGLLALALGALVLLVSLGGTTYPWASFQVIGLGALTLVALGGFVLAEHGAAEPVLPLGLFKNQVFVSAGIVALFLGFAMFGTITFLPLYFQVVRGASPTESGLDLLPLMAGLLITSIAGGQIVSHTGKYRVFPIVGTAIITVGLFLLSGLSPETSTLEAAGYMFVTGFGIGLVMQVLVVAVQNAVGYEDLGVATSGNTLFRNIGSSVGTAVVGTIFATQLASRLRSAFPHASASQLNTSHLSAASLAQLPPYIHAAYLAAFAGSLDMAFKVAGFVSIIAFVSSWFIKELPMRDTVTTQDLGSAFGVPRSSDSWSEICRALGVLVGGQQMRQWLEQVPAEAGTDLPLADCWVLVRLRRDPQVDLSTLATADTIPQAALDGAVADLIERGLLVAGTTSDLVVADGAAGAESANDVLPSPTLSSSGTVVADELIDAVRNQLERLLEGWSPEQFPDLVQLLNQFACDILPGTPTLVSTGAVEHEQ